MGFEPLAYKGLETGERETTSHVIKNGNVVFEFTSSLLTTDNELSQHLQIHGEGVKDVSFEVNDVDLVYERAI